MGRLVHALAIKGCVKENIFIGSAFVDFYRNCRSIENAEKVFREMPENNLVTWNAMISGYSYLGDVDMGLSLFEEMTLRNFGITPNYITLGLVLSACSKAGQWREVCIYLNP